MGFLLCGRFRKPRKCTPTPSPPSYQLVPPESPPPRNELPEGPCSTANSRAPVENERHSSGGWSERIRRRLPSRDSKRLHQISKRADRQTGMSLFSLSRDSDVFATPVTAEDVGSSLMIEKGYDSDAQFVATPKQSTIPITERPLAATDITRDVTPLRNSYPAGEIGVMNGQLQRSVSKKVGNGVDRQHLRHEERNSSHLMLASDLSPQPHRVSSPLSNAADLSVHDRNVESYRPLSMSMSERSVTSAGAGYGIATPPKPMPGHKGRFYATMARQNLHYANRVQAAQTSNARSSESLTGDNLGIMVAKRRQRSSRESSSELRSIHLGDMNISKALALASPPTSSCSISQNPSVDEDTQGNRHSIRSFSDQYHDCVGQRGANTPSWGRHGWNLEIPHRRDASSFYSPKSSISSTGMSRGFHFPDLTANTSSLFRSERGPSGIENAQVPAALISDTSQQSTDPSAMIDPNAANDGSETQTDALKSKFVEEFGINRPAFTRSVSNGSIDQNEALPPRKVSVGWMSGGRRVGYGYSLVAEDEDGNQESQADSNPRPGSTGSEKDGEANGDGIDNKSQDSDGQPVEQDDKRSSTPPELSGSNSDLPGFTNRLTLRRLSGATAHARATRTSDSTDERSVASFFWEKFTGRQNDQEDPGKKADERAIEDHCPESDSHQLLEEQCPKGSVSSGNEDRRSLDRSTGMRLSPSLGTDQHNVAGEGVVAQTGPDVNQFGSLPKKRRRVKFRVLHRKRMRNNHSSADSHPIFPVKRSLWMRDSGLMSRERIQRVSCPEDSFVAPGPGRYRPKHSRRFGPDGTEDDWLDTDQECLEMHSEPE